ncbi:conserved hypothetical protein, partial [Trichinella spiralis]|uniref:hypothetical protein n=1 Tax=Trichinella spiralis TaxID=6334 RepID=UPI0001EFD4B0
MNISDLKGDFSVMDTQPGLRTSFPLTREQPLHQCECAVEFRYNITLGILHFLSQSLIWPLRVRHCRKMILLRLRPEFQEDSLIMDTQRHISLQLLVNKLPAARTLETDHDRLAHRWDWSPC